VGLFVFPFVVQTFTKAVVRGRAEELCPFG